LPLGGYKRRERERERERDARMKRFVKIKKEYKIIKKIILIEFSISGGRRLQGGYKR